MASEVWRWNSDITWHYHSSMVYAAYCTRTASIKHLKYHHARTFAYFAIGVFESVFSKEIRLHLESKKTEEDVIFKKLKHVDFKDLQAKWPVQMYGQGCEFSEEFFDSISKLKAIRNEITHPKRRDHSVFPELDTIACDIDDLATHISVAVAQIAEWRNVPFDYWLTGWNYVGMSGDFAEPSTGTNGNDFVHSLKALGFSHTVCDNLPVGEWERVLMTSVEKFKKLKATLDKCRHDIEPCVERHSQRPRLCRRWWDKEYILGSRSA